MLRWAVTSSTSTWPADRLLKDRSRDPRGRMAIHALAQILCYYDRGQIRHSISRVPVGTCVIAHEMVTRVSLLVADVSDDRLIALGATFADAAMPDGGAGVEQSHNTVTRDGLLAGSFINCVARPHIRAIFDERWDVFGAHVFWRVAQPAADRAPMWRDDGGASRSLRALHRAFESRDGLAYLARAAADSLNNHPGPSVSRPAWQILAWGSDPGFCVRPPVARDSIDTAWES